MSILRQVLFASSLALTGSAFASPTLALPPSEDAEDWSAAASLSGFELVSGQRADARLVSSPHGQWRLIVRDEGGSVQELAVDPPSNDAEREEIAWIARNLLAPVEVTLESTGAKSGPVATKSRPEASFGAGGIIGAPWGASAKLYLPDRTHSLEVAVGANLDGQWSGHGGYLLRPSAITSSSAVDLFWHVGAGIALQNQATGVKNDKSKGKNSEQGEPNPMVSGLRVPVGLDLALTARPVEVFADVAPLIWMDEGTRLQIGLSGGVRYFF